MTRLHLCILGDLLALFAAPNKNQYPQTSFNGTLLPKKLQESSYEHTHTRDMVLFTIYNEIIVDISVPDGMEMTICLGEIIHLCFTQLRSPHTCRRYVARQQSQQCSQQLI